MAYGVDNMKDVHELFLEAYREYPNQDTEGYIPERGSFKTGFLAGYKAIQDRVRDQKSMSNAEKMLLAKKKYRNCDFPLDEACFDIVALRESNEILSKKCRELEQSINLTNIHGYAPEGLHKIFKKLESNNKKLRECVEFYANNETSWEKGKIIPQDKDRLSCGGKLARQTLKELDEEN